MWPGVVALINLPADKSSRGVVKTLNYCADNNDDCVDCPYSKVCHSLWDMRIEMEDKSRR